MAPRPCIPLSFADTLPAPILLSQGAEALLYRTHFLIDIPCVLKYRPSKSYRHPTLDARLTKHRILSEARTMLRLRREGLRVPAVLSVDCERAAEAQGGSGTDRGGERKGGGGWMIMEYVDGRTVREVLQEISKRRKRSEGAEEEGVSDLMGRIGRAVGRMHELGVVHGDLTTSNLMVRPGGEQAGMVDGHSNGKTPEELEGSRHQLEERVRLRSELQHGEVVLIDFGLAVQSIQDEDKAVDLYVLERAFGSTHPEAEDEFKKVLRAYGESYKGARVVLKRLEEVRMRGRKRSMIG